IAQDKEVAGHGEGIAAAYGGRTVENQRRLAVEAGSGRQILRDLAALAVEHIKVAVVGGDGGNGSPGGGATDGQGLGRPGGPDFVKLPLAVEDKEPAFAVVPGEGGGGARRRAAVGGPVLEDCLRRAAGGQGKAENAAAGTIGE